MATAANGAAYIGWNGFSIADGNSWVPTYGNWAGPGYSGGERTETPNEAIGPAKNAIGEISQVDAAAKTHDLSYHNAQGKPNEAELKVEADMQLLCDLANADTSKMSADEAFYASLIAREFSQKIALDLHKLGLDTDPAYISKINEANQLSSDIKNNCSDLMADYLESNPSMYDNLSVLDIVDFAKDLFKYGDLPEGQATPPDTSIVNLTFDLPEAGASAQDFSALSDFFSSILGYGIIGTAVGDLWNSAQNFVRRGDPLALDLDGDGIETVGASTTNPILFDHNADGIKKGTGWVKPDDGFLVLDRNGNGAIDNGTELFGNAMPLTAGGTAANGFAALSQEDTNNDGVVNNQDNNWANLRVWRDLNQDGISRENELFTMEQAGIAGLNLSHTAGYQTVNGNRITSLGTFTKTDGTIGTIADLNLAVDTFHREFPDHIPLAEGLEALPEMRGSGNVRDLREAVSQSPLLQDLLTQFSQAATRREQMALLDQLLDAWADTSGMAETLDERDPEHYLVRYDAFGSVYRWDNRVVSQIIVDGGSGGGSGAEYGQYVRDVDNASLKEDYRQLIAEWSRKIHILEAFNGRYFFSLPQETQEGQSARQGMFVTGGGMGSGGAMIGSVPKTLVVNFDWAQLDMLSKSYEALRESVYSSLILQTRAKPLLDQIILVIENDKLKWDFSELKQHFQDGIVQDPVSGMSDLIEFNRYVAGFFIRSGWEGNEMMAEYISSLPMTPELRAVYSDHHVLLEWREGYTKSGTEKNDIMIADAAGGSFFGNVGNDVIIGGTGSIAFCGGEGDDVLIGGAGNDTLYGQAGNDTYIFRRGSGQDTVIDADTTPNNMDTIWMGSGLTPADIIAERSFDDLTLRILGTDDRLTVKDYFRNYGSTNLIERIQFADGTVWDVREIYHRTILPTEGDDVLYGWDQNDAMRGLGGNDILYGRGGNDILQGNVGNDTIYGGQGGDTLDGGAGNDTIYGGAAVNDYLWGVLSIYDTANGNDTYLFGRGSGQDTIIDRDRAPENIDTILLGSDISPSDVLLQRSGDNLMLFLTGADDKLMVQNWFLNEASEWQVERIQFADGTVWDIPTIKQMVLQGTSGDDMLVGFSTPDTMQGMNGNDQIYGKSGSDTLLGGAGNDKIYGGQGDDTIDGGAGNDYLDGETGSDSYLFGRGFGQDIVNDFDATSGNYDAIILGSDISPSDVQLQRREDDLVLSLIGADDTLTVSNWFLNDSNVYQVEQIRFSDGTVWDAATIKQQMPLLGTPGEDVLYGYSTPDVLQGFAGNDKLYGRAGEDTLDGGEGDDYVYGEAGNDTLHGDEGSDALFGGQGADRLYGGADTDKLVGGSGDDVLDGGQGDDTLCGGYDVQPWWFYSISGHYLSDNGNDTYLFGSGSGNDSIYDYDERRGLDTILLDAGITPADVTLRRVSDNLVLSLNGDDDSISVINWFVNEFIGSWQVEHINFADGTVWDTSVMKQMALQGTSGNDVLVGYDLTGEVIQGLAGDDLLYGESGDDALYGGDGKDIIFGGQGNDTLDGGAGNDILFGGGRFHYSGYTWVDNWQGALNDANGNDTYHFGRGSGQDITVDRDAASGNLDTIYLAADMQPADVTLRRQNDELVLSIAGASDTLTVRGWFWQDSGEYQVESIQFADGTAWDVPVIKQMVMQGTPGDDYLVGYSSDDILDGGAGNDMLIGNKGNETYIFGRGYGIDTIMDYDTTPGNIDTVMMGVDVLPTDVELKRWGNDLHLSIIGTNDRLQITNWFTGNGFEIERIQFADGMVWDSATLPALINTPTDTDDYLKARRRMTP